MRILRENTLKESDIKRDPRKEVKKLLKELWMALRYADFSVPTGRAYTEFHKNRAIYTKRVGEIIEIIDRGPITGPNSLLKILTDLRDLMISNDIKNPSGEEQEEIHENYTNFISGISDAIDVAKEEY